MVASLNLKKMLVARYLAKYVKKIWKDDLIIKLFISCYRLKKSHCLTNKRAFWKNGPFFA